MSIAIILLAIGAFIDTLGDIIMKKWVINKSIWIFIFGMFTYLIGLGFLAYSYNYKNIAVASVIFVILNIVMLSIASYFYFGESLSLLQIVGITIGIIAIVVLELT
jgi:multidrug transporter EmrE-like cation transporter